MVQKPVFSSWIRRKDSNRIFELCDPNGDFWEQLPQLPCRLCDSQGWWNGFPCSDSTSDEIDKVMSYSFIDESHFLIVTTEIQDCSRNQEFALDLENRAWVELRLSGPH